MAPMITPAQSRAARALLSWSRADLAAASRLDEAVIAAFEDETRPADAEMLTTLASSFDTAGVAILAAGENVTGGPGVRLRHHEAEEGLRPDELNASNDG